MGVILPYLRINIRTKYSNSFRHTKNNSAVYKRVLQSLSINVSCAIAHLHAILSIYFKLLFDVNGIEQFTVSLILFFLLCKVRIAHLILRFFDTTIKITKLTWDYQYPSQ